VKDNAEVIKLKTEDGGSIFLRNTAVMLRQCPVCTVRTIPKTITILCVLTAIYIYMSQLSSSVESPIEHTV